MKWFHEAKEKKKRREFPMLCLDANKAYKKHEMIKSFSRFK